VTAIVRIARTTSVTTFNPLRYNDQGTGEVLNRLYSHLIVTDSADRYVYGSLVAQAHQTNSPDRVRYELRLRDDARWHDGKEVTAADVEFTIARVLDPALGSPRRPELLACGHDLTVSADGPHTVRIEFTPTGGAGIRALAWLPVVPAHLSKGSADDAARQPDGHAPVGSGEFRFESYDEADGTVTLRANQAHWAPPRLDSVHWHRFADSAAAVDSVLRGESDLATSVRPSLAAAIEGSSGVRVHTSSNGSCTYLGLNTLSGPLRDRDVRAALATAIDRQHLVDAVLGRHGLPARTLIHPRSGWHCPDAADYRHDRRAAGEALDRAGWRLTASGARANPGGTVLSLNLLTVLGDDVKQETAGLIARQLAQLGIEVHQESAAMADLLNDRVYPQRYEMVVLALNPGPSPSFLRAFYHSGGGETGANRFGYASQAVDHLIDAMPPMDDEESARGPVREIQRLVALDVPHVPLFFPDVVDVASSRLVLDRLDGLFNNRFSDLHRWDVTVPIRRADQG
jgi:peptide/nickel transport system substrate-binding protein